MDRISFLKEEIGYIINPDIRNFAIKAIMSLPDYFFTAESSSTKKYHPSYALGEGGILRHTKACVRFAIECFRLQWYKSLSEDEKDLVIVSLLLHDGWKRGIELSQYSVENHPMLAAQQIQKNIELQGIISDEYLNIILNNIKSHMGQWAFDRISGEKLMPFPETTMEKLIHFVDYVCSRPMFEVNFDILPTRE